MKFYSKENLKFLLFNVHRTQDLCKYERFKNHSRENFEMILDAADSLAENHLRPILVEMDRNPPKVVDGRIKVHPNMKSLMKTFGESGWISMSAPEKFGGQGIPFTISQTAGFIFAAANYSSMAYPGLTTGAAQLIESFGSEALQNAFVPKMYSGEWQGTMALTEPEAGSSLSDLKTSAVSHADGTFRIRGQKIFISCGDHDACENIVHLMLARIEGAPAGTKGISLFVVPQKRVDEIGNLVWNDVNTAGMFHKMGYHGAPIAHLMMGEENDCHAYLVGEPHKGLSYMFQMMNEARISVGLQATAIASAAYYNALEYCNVRLQGRQLSAKNPELPQVPIIEHADVKRLLLFQKSIVEGSLSLLIQAMSYLDKHHATEGDEKEKNFLLLEILTPVVKSYPAEMSNLTTSAALQCFGGYGFTKDFLAELFYRETRIHTLHEGTTAIHGMDLLGRKVMLKNGMATMLLMQEIMSDSAKAETHAALKSYAQLLQAKLLRTQEVTTKLFAKAQANGPDAMLADATLYLELFGIVCVSWQWLKQGVSLTEDAVQNFSSEFVASKWHTLKYYFEYELPKADYLLTRLNSSVAVTMDAKPNEIL